MSYYQNLLINMCSKHATPMMPSNQQSSLLAQWARDFVLITFSLLTTRKPMASRTSLSCSTVKRCGTYGLRCAAILHGL